MITGFADGKKIAVLKKVKEIDYETLGPDSQDMLDSYELVKFD